MNRRRRAQSTAPFFSNKTMGSLKPKHKRSGPADHVKEVFLAEALGHVAAFNVLSERGKVILPKGSVIHPRVIGRLAAKGIDRVAVFHKPRISIITIGDGLVAPGSSLLPGKTYDANHPMLQAALEFMRIRPVFIRRLVNRQTLLKRLIPFALNQCDIMILLLKEARQGADWLRGLIKDSSAEIIFPAEGSKAGSPRYKGARIVFCLPYDSDTIFECFYKSIQPAIQSFMGYPNLGEGHVG